MSPDLARVLLYITIALTVCVFASIILYEFRNMRRLYSDRADSDAADKAELAALSETIGGPLYFRRPIGDDAEFIRRVNADPETRDAQRWSSDDKVPSVEEFRDGLSVERLDMLVGVERSTEQPVGFASYDESAVESTDSISIGLLSDPVHRGKGYGRQVLGAAIWLLQDRIRAHGMSTELYVGTAVDNGAVQHIMNQLGYEPEPDTRPYEAPNGETIESYWYRCGPTTQSPVLTDSTA